MTPADAAELVTIVALGWPRPGMQERTRDFYEQMLLDLDFEVAKRAVARLAATAKFLPSIAEIREAALEVVAGPRRSGMEAWGDVLEMRESFGWPQQSEGSWTPAGAPLLPPPFKDPIVALCVERMGGWGAFRQVDFDRGKFCELYDTLSQQVRKEQQVGAKNALQLEGWPRGNMATTARSLLGGIGNGGKR
jgi:hypothetical protein